MQIYEILGERARASEQFSPRAARLRELEQDPPEWLVAKIGRPVGPTRKFGGRMVRQRAWRRAAIARDDYRTAVGAEEFMRTDPPVEPGLRAIHAATVRQSKSMKSLDSTSATVVERAERRE